MFLDIASIFANKPKHLLLAAWTSIHGVAAELFFESLLSNSLLTVSNSQNSCEEVIQIHDVLRELGREQINFPDGLSNQLPTFQWSRLWIPESEAIVQGRCQQV